MMEIRWSVMLVIAGTSLVTILPRVLPLVFLSRMNLPDWLRRWLSFVPVAVMSALLAQELLVPKGRLSLADSGYALLAAAVAFVVAFRTRSLFGTVLAGIGVMIVLRSLG